MKVSKHFNTAEFVCKGNLKLVCSCKGTYVTAELIQVLEDVRNNFKKPVIIISGYRCPKYNSYVGGAKESKHMLGIAADIKVKDVPPSEVFRYLRMKYYNKYGIGSYPTFTHIDVRPTKARWRKI